MKISVLIDNPRSWFVPFGAELARRLRAGGHEVAEVADPRALPAGDIAFFLSCEQIIGAVLRARNMHNIVIHASALPQGKGWSPMAWQIIEGKNDIPVTLFEAADKVDAGAIYDTATIHFEGHELIDELRQQEGAAIVGLAEKFVNAYPAVNGRPQEGDESFYPRRTPADSELDSSKPLSELFNQLRVADNERYPAFFTHQGQTYTLKIFKRE